jgi:hypothetical protein
MSFQIKYIKEYGDIYKEKYLKQFGIMPKSWFTYLRWLATDSFLGNFDYEDIECAKEVLGVRE